MKFNAYSDPGHAWVRVPMSLLIKLNIHNKISNFSFRRNDWAYLEEDMDYATFVNAMNDTGKRVELVVNSTNRRSRIRSYDRYHHSMG